MAEQRVKVLCVDDSHDIVQLYSRMVNGEPDMCCVGTLGQADALADEVERTQADVVVLDLSMPGRDPLEALSDLSRQIDRVRTIVFSGYDDAQTVDAALNAGAWGLVSKHANPMEVIEAIRRVAQGQTHFPARKRGNQDPGARR
jgi:DNA-binding NarL/FixJ family response regulator